MSNNLFNQLTILYVNEDVSKDNAELKILYKHTKEIVTTTTVKGALDIYSTIQPDIIITDIKLSDASGFKLVKKIRKLNAYQPIIVKTKNLKKKHMSKALDLQVDSYLLTPINEDELIQKVLYVGKKHVYRKKNIEKRELLQSILDNQSGLVMLTDFKNIEYSSKSFLEFFHLETEEELFNRYDTVLDLFIKHDDYLHGDSKEEFLEKFKNSKALKKVVLVVGKQMIPKAFHLDINKVENSTKELYIITLTNISIMQEKNIEISYKAYIDNLTGVYNRNKFEEVFEYESQRAIRYKNDLCIAVLDVDHFKKFNDTYGHLIGDEVLSSIAKIINENIRKLDLFARWGGEEFVLLMPESNIDEAYLLCEKLRRLIQEYRHPTAGEVTCSFGVTNFEMDDHLTSVFKRCDEALYNAKANGRNRVEKL